MRNSTCFNGEGEKEAKKSKNGSVIEFLPSKFQIQIDEVEIPLEATNFFHFPRHDDDKNYQSVVYRVENAS